MISRRAFNKYLATTTALTLTGLDGQARPSNIFKKAIPSSGVAIPAIGMGTWITFDLDMPDSGYMEHISILDAFFKAGGSMIDSSPMYGSAQKNLGITLPKSQGHQQLMSATKIWIPGKDNGIQQMDLAAKLWGIPQFDLIYVHNMLDWENHLPTLNQWKQEGTLKYTGLTTSHGRRHKALSDVMRSETLDFVQFSYNLHDRDAEKRLLPLAQDKGIAVVINRPFQTGGLFTRVGNKPLPDWAIEIECNSWSQFFLKFIISHPAVTCVIPATSQVLHMQENMRALRGTLPDAKMREEMIRYYESITSSNTAK
ncbi:aldo/keto reductase [Marinicella sp. W31]|uniref:aldo/keto reductase n=1 Tax=Marinicella sp. W31 TaxID=3023713 RepID=UPI003756CF9D